MVLASSKQLLLITIAIALCRHLREAIADHIPPEPPEECTESAWPCPACFAGDTPDELLKYALKVSNASMEYTPENVEAITVRVHSKSCPSLNATDFHSLPNWFRLEAISEATTAAVGQFERPNSRSESFLCSESIIFSTPETAPLDFPKTFTWKAPMEDVPERVCFRLTLHSNRHWCQQTKTCISLRPESTSEMSGSASASGEFESQEAPGNADSMCPQSRVDRCYKNWNCTGKKMVRFCGSNGIMFNSRCERRLWECLTNKTIKISRNFTACMPSCDNTAANQSGICHIWQQDQCAYGESWQPRCTRKGLFKLVQCDTDQCWCVYSNAPGEIQGTLGYLDCKNPESYNFAASCSAS